MNCRNISSYVSLGVLTLLLPFVAIAQVTPVIFEKTAISINPVIIDGEESREPTSYDIEVRPEDALRLEYIHTLNTLTETGGVAIVFTAPTMMGLPAMQVFTPVDALFVTENGTILQIYPGVVLGELEQEVIAKEPVKAFVFLAAGQVQARNIKPYDIIAGPMFSAPPPVME